MKKFVLGFMSIFFILGCAGGLTNLVTEKSDDKLGDVIILLLCICFSALFLYLFYKTYKNQNVTTTLKNEHDEQLKNENIRLKKEIHELQDELNNKNNLINEAQNTKYYIAEKEVEFKESQKRYEQLKNSIDSKDNLIEQLKNSIDSKDNLIKQLKNENEALRKNLKQLEDTHLSYLKTNKNQKTDKEIVTTQNLTELDLSYSKVRKVPSTFVVLDFETTGLDYKENEIIQYGIVEFKNGSIINELTRFFKPNTPVGKTVARKTGITNEFLKDKPNMSKFYMEEMLMLMGGKTIIAHNAPFDMKFLLKYLHDFFIEHEKFRVFDTLTYSRKLINETSNHKLETLKDYFDLDNGSSHQALNDAKATGQLALLLKDRME